MAPQLLSSIFSKISIHQHKRSSITINKGPANLKNDPFPRPHKKIGNANSHLYNELLEMYWKGVNREIANILLTLRTWQFQDEYSQTTLPDEQDDFIHGYDTFLDQVSHSSRNFAERYAQKMKLVTDPSSLPSYEEALRDCGWDMLADQRSGKMKEAIRQRLDQREKPEKLRRRAKMLLQAGQFLDIDKAIEYHDGGHESSTWKRPAVTQLVVSGVHPSTDMPIFVPQLCGECNHEIRGSMFKQVPQYQQERDTSLIVCETCYRERHFAAPDFTKLHKHCCLNGAIDSRMSQRLCRCLSVTGVNGFLQGRTLFPIQRGDRHVEIQTGKKSPPRCNLYAINDLVANAKYKSIISKTESKQSLDDVTTSHRMQKSASDANTGSAGKVWRGKTKVQLPPPDKTGPEFRIFRSAAKTNDVPCFLRPTPDLHPYGNVPIALRFGPLVFTNGIDNGVTITSRDPQNLQVLYEVDHDIEDSLLLTGSTNRALYSQRIPRSSRRYKATMKEVVGGAFCGLLNPAMEREILDLLIQESCATTGLGVDTKWKADIPNKSVAIITGKLREYLSPYTEFYLASLVDRLLDTKLPLNWNFETNDCYDFCDRLINRTLFGPLIAQKNSNAAPIVIRKVPAPRGPLYLMSFICRRGAYQMETVGSKYDVPNGLTEEYLYRLPYGRHDESDILDTLAEYWHDWGGFGGELYRYQDVFPWDCTEAYNRYPVKCNNCNLSKHAWAFPFDSWSIISLHLSRIRHLYPAVASPSSVDASTRRTEVKEVASSAAAVAVMSDLSWFRNRLTVLLAQDVLLTGAVAMVQSDSFREHTAWLNNQQDLRMERFKIGGIHRAQPYSHHFEKGAYSLYFTAEWAPLERRMQIQAYELLRNKRATQKDVKDDAKDDEEGNRYGGFVCGGIIAACAGGCSSKCGGGCGSGCVSVIPATSNDGGGGGDGGDGCGGDGGGGGCGGGCGG
ncbi:hypothetical protein FQN57_001567 [Myotisia sp. PD_48]|nr:hypothetical protein FQN57_001567 [Myotisia sp. PD_48]